MHSDEHIATSAERAAALLYGILCHAAFAAAVGVMAVSLYGGLQIGLGRLTGAWACLANGLLILQFPVVHSMLLSKRGRPLLSALAPKSIGRKLQTTNYVLAASVQLLLTFGLWSPSGVVLWEFAGPARWVSNALFTGSWLLLAESMREAGLGVQAGYLGWLSVYTGRAPVWPPLPTRGLFALCRQPIYFSFALILWTGPVWSVDKLMLGVPWTLYCIFGPCLKERRFAACFGEAFKEYQLRVPYFFPVALWGRGAKPSGAGDGPKN